MRVSIPYVPLFVLVGALPCVPTAAPAQSAETEIRYGEPVRLPVAEEIALARSAAPAAVSAEATVLVLEESAERWVVGAEGSNGATCYVSRTWEGSVEPQPGPLPAISSSRRRARPRRSRSPARPRISSTAAR